MRSNSSFERNRSMETLQLTQMPEAKTAMLIRRPVEEVIEEIFN
jgi:hypothetical protein